MAGTIAITAACLIVVFIISRLLAWQQNYALAQKAGWRTYYSPVHMLDVWWFMLQSMLVPALQYLPHAWTRPWLELTQVGNIWKAGYTPFENADSDSIMLATPRGNLLYTSDPKVISHVFHSHQNAHIPTEIVAFHDIYGPTLITTEGAEWAFNRKVISAAFGPATNATVWTESIKQARGLLDLWAKSGSVVPVVRSFTSRLSLHVASSVFFDRPLSWEDQKGVKLPGCTLSYTEALFQVLDSLDLIFHIPDLLLRNLPFKATKDAYLAFTEWTRYLEDLRDSATTRMNEIVDKPNRTMLESVVVAGNPSAVEAGAPRFSPEQVIGNIFLTLHVGHHTTGNTLGHALNLLALHPGNQVEIQKEVDAVFGDRSPEEWSIEEDWTALFQGFTGAVLKETQRLYSVVQFLPRRTISNLAVTDSAGKTRTIPKDTFIILDFAAAFRHPAYWSRASISSKVRSDVHDSPALDFDPTRWLIGDPKNRVHAGDEPLHFPFGQGRRVCPGQAFAQTEMIAVLATIFRFYTLQLVVGEDVLIRAKGNKPRAWEMAREEGLRKMVDGIQFNVNIYLDKELPFKLVPRQ